MSFRLSNL